MTQGEQEWQANTTQQSEKEKQETALNTRVLSSIISYMYPTQH